MTAIEIQDFIHVYSLIAFRDGRRESGILVNKYNSSTGCVDFYFIEHSDMQAYKTAFENYDHQACARLSTCIDLNEINSVRPVTLADYRIIMQLLAEKKLGSSNHSIYN
jgi:hypothetical protein